MANPTKATITIALPTARTDSSPLAASDIASVRIYRAVGATAPTLLATVLGPFSSGTVTYVDSTIALSTSYNYTATAVDLDGDESAQSNAFPLVVPAPEAAPNAPTIVNITLA